MASKFKGLPYTAIWSYTAYDVTYYPMLSYTALCYPKLALCCPILPYAIIYCSILPYAVIYCPMLLYNAKKSYRRLTFNFAVNTQIFTGLA